MAYTAVITKQSVRKISVTTYEASIQMVVNDGQSDVFTETASAKYNSNAPDMSAIKSALQSELIEKWDKWQAEQNVFEAAAFNTMIGQIQTAANNYVNQ